MNELYDTPEVAIDTETTGLVVWRDLPLYFSLAWQNRRATLHRSLLPYFKPMFDHPERRWVLANAKYDNHILANEGYPLEGLLVDTQVAHALLYEEQPHGLKEMAGSLLGWKWLDFQDTFGRINKMQSPAQLIARAEYENFPLLIEYAANDAWGTKNVHNVLQKQLLEARTHSLFNNMPPYINTLHDLFWKVEVPYTKVLWKNERNGILIDLPLLEQAKPVAEAEIKQHEKNLAQLAGTPHFNPNSTPQLKAFFFDVCQVKPTKMTKGGKSGKVSPSVDASFLEHYAELNLTGAEPNFQGESRAKAMAQALVKYRDVSKLYGTYIVGLSSKVDPTGRIHTRFNQDVARTGRLSSADPNLQNIPNPENDSWKIRRAFIAPPGYKLIVADYRQLEMRLLACAAMEKDMVDIFLRGWDIHMGNASLMYGIPYEEIYAAKKKSGDLFAKMLPARIAQCVQVRSDAKAIGFGLNYGMREAKLAATLGCTVEEAIKKIEQYKATYPAVTHFYEEAIRETELTGYAFTILGRRRNVPEIRSPRRMERMKAERISVNTQIQGSAADVVKMAQIVLDKLGMDRRFDCRSNLQVHDELVHTCPELYVPECKSLIIEFMEHPFHIDLAVPLEVDCGVHQTWFDAK